MLPIELSWAQVPDLLEVVDDRVITQIIQRIDGKHLAAKHDVGRVVVELIDGIRSAVPQLLQAPDDRFNYLLVAIQAMHARLRNDVSNMKAHRCGCSCARSLRQDPNG